MRSKWSWFTWPHWIHIGRWHISLWVPAISVTTNGWKLMEKDKWEMFISLLNSNPWYLIGLKKYGKYT